MVLTSLRLLLGATKAKAAEPMRQYPDHGALARPIIDFACDGGSDIRGALARIEDNMPRRPDRGGAHDGFDSGT
jgi:hypothetical protein